MASPLVEHGRAKFPGAGVIATCAGRGWPTVHAERRRHAAGELPSYRSSVTEITVAMSDVPGAKVHRSGLGRRQVADVRAGTIWLCPAGVFEDGTVITRDLPDILHVTLPRTIFDDIRTEVVPSLSPTTLRYESGVDDPLLRHMLLALAAELARETTSGTLFVEATALALGTRLALRHASNRSAPAGDVAGLDDRRLSRVVEYVEERLEEDITIAELAGVACLSRFHFSRAFRRATGRTPQAFVAERRLKHGKSLLRHSERSVSEIAAACGFSSQAAFAKAFARAVGVPPSRYRREA